MRRNRLLTPALVLLATGLSACGSSKAPGVQPAPSGGTTAPAVAAAPTTSTTSSTATQPTVATPKTGPLSKKPVVTPPKGPAPAGLVVKDLIKGTGAVAKPGSNVTVNYVGVLYKGGKEFDSSWKRATPAPFQLKSGPGGVISGFANGIPGMRVGGRRELIIPAKLAYGSSPTPGIPPNSPLVFVVDLLGAA
jgi:peptidylprolyl isomerase